MCTPYLEKLKPTFCRDSWNVAMYIWLQLFQILTDFNNFCSDETGKMYKTGHAFTYLLLKECVANAVINVSLFACCEPRHRRVEASSVSLRRRWRRPFWTLLMIATLKITMSKWQHCKYDNWRWLSSVLFCCEHKWTRNNSVFNWKVLLFKFTK